MKKALSILLALALIFSITPLSGFVGLELRDAGIYKKLADSVSDFFDGFATKAVAATYSGTCGENLNWHLDTSTGLLSITGTGKMTDYSYKTAAPWKSYCSYIKDVSFQNGIESIGDYAFYGCDLKGIIIPDGVTQIGMRAFEFGINGNYVLLPQSVTLLETEAFFSVDGNGNYGLNYIYYTGTSSQWENINKERIPNLYPHFLSEGEAWYRADSYKINSSGHYVLSSACRKSMATAIPCRVKQIPIVQHIRLIKPVCSSTSSISRKVRPMIRMY